MLWFIDPVRTVQFIYDSMLGKHISDFCKNNFHDDSANHCAHFVGHMWNIDVGYNCKAHKGGKEPGACLRVHTLFENCATVGKWADKPAGVIHCLAFVTDKSNVDVAKKTMSNVPNKHVGIFVFDKIYHYKNSQKQVVKQTPEEFNAHYAGKGITVYYGTWA
jgi:hypothetical protein